MASIYTEEQDTQQFVRCDNTVSPEEIKEAAMSKTNKAFDKYLGQANDSDILSIYRQGAAVIPISKIDTALIPDFEGSENAK